MATSISYDQFCKKRYDIVLRYHLLSQANFDISKAHELFLSNTYAPLRSALQRVNPRLLKKGLFDTQTWTYVEDRIQSDAWRKTHPYRLTSHGYGENVKRLLLALKHDVSLYWTIHDGIKEKDGFHKEDITQALPKEMKVVFEQAEAQLISALSTKHMFESEYRVYRRTPFVDTLRTRLFLLKKRLTQKPDATKQLSLIVLWQSGEQHTKQILRSVQKKTDLIEVYRFRTQPQKDFFHMMMKLYAYDGAKPEKISEKIEALGDRTSFLLIVCRARKMKLYRLKKRLRRTLRINALHTTEDTEESIDILKQVFAFSKEDVFALANTTKKKTVPMKKLYDFSNTSFVVRGNTLHPGTYNSIEDVFATMHAYPYAVVHFGGTYDEIVAQEKDIEILTPYRTNMIDILGATHIKKESVYSITIGDKRLKLDFYYSVRLPQRWKNHIMATRIASETYNHDEPTPEDCFWIHMYNRTIQNPYKFKNEARYPHGGGWQDLVLWGNRIGVYPRIHPSISHLRAIWYIARYLQTRIRLFV